MAKIELELCQCGRIGKKAVMVDGSTRIICFYCLLEEYHKVQRECGLDR